ncbi:MAG: hypothetical protein LBJ48_06075, partial [Coriobacteriales bacterium]|nr:hypothetical protein [Coriobacteriales bacterium]
MKQARQADKATMTARKSHGRRLEVRDACGSTLVWVMVVAIVLTLVIASIGTVISFNFHNTSLNRTQTQAYYTAESVNARIVTWLSGIPAPGSITPGDEPDNYGEIEDPYEFIEDLKDAYPDGSGYPEVRSYSEAELGGNMGTATTTVEFTSDKCDEIKITTTAKYAGTEETLSTWLYLQQLSYFDAIKTDFNYSEESIAEALADVASLPGLAENATWMPEYRYGAQSANKSWSYFEVRAPQDNVPANYKFDLLSVAKGDYNNGTVTHNYSYKYLASLGTFQDLVYVGLNPTRGTFLITQNTEQIANSQIDPIDNTVIGTSTNERITDGFPYNTKEGGKGVLLTETGTFVGRVVYYTLDYPYNQYFTESDWPDLTLATYYPGDDEYTSIRRSSYYGLSLYLTDSSKKTLEINTGITIHSGTLYTRRSAAIGTIFNDGGRKDNDKAIPYSKKNNLIFTNYDFIFADPGEGQTRRESVIAGPNYYSGGSDATAKTELKQGSILVQNNHELTVGTGA